MTQEIGAIVLSRFSSSRLPGKALMEIEGKQVLDYITERLFQVLPKQKVTIATSDEASDNPIEKFASSRNLACFRGSLNNVSQRFLSCAEEFGWDYAVRINGDNIFVDTSLLKTMIETARAGQYDFISNVKDRTYPKGMSIEIIKTSYYRSIYPQIIQYDYHKEHVTSYIYDDKSAKTFYFRNEKTPEIAGIQLALDTIDDFERTKTIIGKFSKPHWEYSTLEIIDIWKNTHDNI